MTNAFDTSDATLKSFAAKRDISATLPLLGMTTIPRTRIELATVLLAVGVISFGLWNWVVRASALSFGPPEAVWLGQKSAAPGESVMVHFDSVTWYRLCRSETHMSFQPKNGPRLDFKVHQTSTPAATGKMSPKSRPLEIPQSIEPNQYGPGMISGHVSSGCWPFEGLPIIAPLPDVPFELVKR